MFCCRDLTVCGRLVLSLFMQAFLKKHVSEEDLDGKGHKLAQLVDGKAQKLFEEFEALFHETSGVALMGMEEFQSLSAVESDFALGLLGQALMMNASGFDRRVRQHCMDFPHLLLALARVRPEFPDVGRQNIAKSLLKRAAENTLDTGTKKIISIFKDDVQMAAGDGTLGVRLYICLRALRRLWLCDVRENERINKCLKLLGQRCPNANLDLISARCTLKYMLGTVGALQRGLDVNVKTRKWSHIAPLAASVADTCLEHWQASQEVMEQEDRWAPAGTPPWMPGPGAVHDFAASQAATRTRAPAVAASSLLATHVNRSLCRFYDKGECQRGAEIEVPPMTAILFVNKKQIANNSLCSIPDAANMYFMSESVNRAMRLLKGTLHHTTNGIVCKPNRPWTFVWAADAVMEVLKTPPNSSSHSSHSVAVAVPLQWSCSALTMELTGRGVCTVREDERHAHVAEAGSAKHCLHCLLVLVGWLHFFMSVLLPGRP